MNLPIKLELPDGFLEEEVRCDYCISKQMKEVWAVELDLLNEFDRICKNHGIRYFACAGTMLGAVRHKGIIPWDDDIDVMMLRDEYEKICSLSNKFSAPYFFQTESNDKGSLRGHAQLRNSETTAILESELSGKYSFNQGVFIDIFPLDNIPDDVQERNNYITALRQKKRTYQRIRYIPSHPGDSKSIIKKAFRYMLSPWFHFFDTHLDLTHKMCLVYEDCCKKYSSIETKQTAILALAELGERFVYDKSDFVGATYQVPFEFLEIPLPHGYLNILEKTYGDWKKPLRIGTNHGGVIFDCYLPYDDYLEKY